MMLRPHSLMQQKKHNEIVNKKTQLMDADGECHPREHELRCRKPNSPTLPRKNRRWILEYLLVPVKHCLSLNWQRYSTSFQYVSMVSVGTESINHGVSVSMPTGTYYFCHPPALVVQSMAAIDRTAGWLIRWLAGGYITFPYVTWTI